MTTHYLKIPVDYTVHILDQLVLVEDKKPDENKENDENSSQETTEIQEEDEKVKNALNKITKIHDGLGTLPAKHKRKFKNLLDKYKI